jgi:hypothetical protein
MKRKAERCNRRVALVLTTALVLNAASPAFAHNERIHQAMTDYPVVIDNDYAIWRAFDNHYWPAL